MTVKELIKELKKYDGEAKVWAYDQSGGIYSVGRVDSDDDYEPVIN